MFRCVGNRESWRCNDVVREKQEKNEGNGVPLPREMLRGHVEVNSSFNFRAQRVIDGHT